jgi:hypothetical protein
MSGREMGNTQDSQEPLSDEQIDALVLEYRGRIYPQDQFPHFERALVRAALTHAAPARNGGETGEAASVEVAESLGDAATRPGLSAPLRSAPIPIAACGGWVRMEDAAPPADTTCAVWLRYSPGPGHFGIDRWEMQREDPIGMGGPTIETGYGWSDNYENDVIYWLALAPVPDQNYDPRNQDAA